MKTRLRGEMCSEGHKREKEVGNSRCDRASFLEVIADLTMIGLSMLPFRGTVLYTYHIMSDQ